MKIYLVFLVSLFSFLSYSQKGTVTGLVTDKDAANASLPFANVVVKGTTNGVTTDENGKYSLSLDAGVYILQFSFIGYEATEATVNVVANKTQIVNGSLGSGGYQLEDVVITAVTRNREKESALIVEQKNAIEMKQAIGAQELSRKGVSDAAGAVSKTAGVSEQEGVKNVFVRGLGDRYNSTTLNGLPMPSEDPEYKNISLKFFSSNIIKNVNVNKTFNAGIYGDVGGANIDISSKELDQNKLLSLTAGTGYNSAALGTNFLVADGYNYFGLLKNGSGIPINNLSNYGFETSFDPNEQNNTINYNFSFLGGRKFDLGGDKKLSIFGVVLSNSEFVYKEGRVAQVNNQGGFKQNLEFKKYEYGASQTGLGTIDFTFGKGKSIVYNALFIHDNIQSVGDYSGFNNSINDNEIAQNSFIRRQQVNNNTLITNQLLFNYKFSEKLDVNAGVSYNRVDGSEPDRRTNSFDYDYDNENYVIGSNSPALNNRFFSKLQENDFTAKADFTFTLNPEADLVKKINFGTNYRRTERRFDYTQFNFDFPNNTTAIEINNADAVFNQANLSAGNFEIVTGRGINADALDPLFYLGDKQIVAGYAQMVYPFSEKFTVQAGVRYENVQQLVQWDTNLGSSFSLTDKPSYINKDYFLPSLTGRFELNSKNIIRFAASQTYTLPQFKENALFLYEDVNFSSFGNPNLVPAENLNFDLKYEWYLSNKEIISLGTFYKSIKDPINRIRVASAANELSYVNLGDAFATGFELEVRKNLYEVKGDTNSKNLAVGLNLSYLYTNVKVVDNPNDKITVLPTNDESKLEGASPLLINSDLSYNFSNKKNSLTSSIVFNYFYDKVYSIGTATNQNIVEKAVPTLDFVNKFEFIKNKLGINLSIKNILNPTFNLTQDTFANDTRTESVVGSFKKGIFASFGVFWNL
jgi:TonB-dependent receptor